MKGSAVAPATQGLINVHGYCRDHGQPKGRLLHCALSNLTTTTTVQFLRQRDAMLLVNGKPLKGPERQRILEFMATLREEFDLPEGLRMCSVNSFPSKCGLGSSASAFAALALASSIAARKELAPHVLARIAGQGSLTAGSSIIGGVSSSRPGMDGPHGGSRRELDPDDFPTTVIGVAIESKRISADIHQEARRSVMYKMIAHKIEPQAKKVVRILSAGDWETAGKLVETNVALNHALISTG